MRKREFIVRANSKKAIKAAGVIPKHGEKYSDECGVHVCYKSTVTHQGNGMYRVESRYRWEK